MRREGNRLVCETRNCICNHPAAPCPAGRVAGRQACSECKGTGNGKRGGKGGCRKCHGFGTQPDFVNHVECGSCEGTGIVPETIYDGLPTEIWAGLDFRVFRTDRQQTWNEQWLGIGYCWTSTDYGRAWAGTDEALLEYVRNERCRVQACKVAREDGTLCDFVAIAIMPHGYTVHGVFSDEGRDPRTDHATEEALSLF